MTPDPWCVVYDMGSFDLIVCESSNYQTVQSYVQNCQHLYDKQLTIMLRSETRLLLENWLQVELCSGATVREPERIKS